jgi:Holliday junction resolvase
MTTKTIGKQAEREAKKMLEAETGIRVVIKSEVSSYYEGSIKDSGPVDLVAIRDGTGYQVKTTKRSSYYFDNDELFRILQWKYRTGLDVKYAIKFRRGKGKPVHWFFVDATEDLKDSKAVLKVVGRTLSIVTEKVKKRNA